MTTCQGGNKTHTLKKKRDRGNNKSSWYLHMCQGVSGVWYKVCGRGRSCREQEAKSEKGEEKIGTGKNNRILCIKQLQR